MVGNQVPNPLKPDGASRGFDVVRVDAGKQRGAEARAQVVADDAEVVENRIDTIANY